MASRVGGVGVADAVMELLRHRRAADHGPPVHHLHPQPRGGQVAGAGQAVVSGADDDGIEGLGGAHGRTSRKMLAFWNHRTGGKSLDPAGRTCRSEEHTSELQSLMRISYAVFCLKKKKH